MSSVLCVVAQVVENVTRVTQLCDSRDVVALCKFYMVLNAASFQKKMKEHEKHPRLSYFNLHWPISNKKHKI